MAIINKFVLILFLNYYLIKLIALLILSMVVLFYYRFSISLLI